MTFEPTPIFAFGFANLPMLGWLAAAAAPILIHLLSRQRYREMPWAAMEYLLAAIRRQSRRLRFEQLLLLAIRTLLVVLVVLAVAEPYAERIGFAVPSRGRTHRVLVVDGSYSMAYRPTDRSRFEQAKQLARQIVDESAQGDAFTLLLMASPPRVVVGRPALEPSEVLAEIDNLKLTHTAADVPATVAAAEQLIRDASREDPSLGAHEVYFLTDLQKVDWAPGLSGPALADFRKRSQKLAESAALVVIDLGQPAADNLAVTDLKSLEPLAMAGREMNLQAAVKDYGGQARPRQPVELLVDGRRVGQQVVDVPAGGAAPLTFSYRFETPGDHTLEVRAAGDALDVDNHRYLAAPVRQSLRVLCVDGRPSGEPRGGAAGYLALALAPQAGDAARPPVEVDVAPESAVLERELGRYDCVFLCDVAQFTPGEVRVLDAYLGSGGNLVFFLGPQVLPDRYNRELGGQDGGPRLLPARLGPVVDQPQFRLDPLDYGHPIVAPFRGRTQSGLLTTPILKHFKLEPRPDSAAQVALRITGGDPLLVEEPIRRGHVVLWATSADTSWTAMPVWPSFVPLVQETLSYCVGSELRQRNLAVGEPLGGSVFAPAADVPISVQPPDGAARPVRLQPEGDYGAWSFSDTLLSGIYAVRFGSPINREQKYAVNVDTGQSDLAQLGEDALRTDVWPGIEVDVRTTWQNLDRPAGGTIARRARLPVELLYLALGLALVETVLAWRFGHHGA